MQWKWLNILLGIFNLKNQKNPPSKDSCTSVFLYRPSDQLLRVSFVRQSVCESVGFNVFMTKECVQQEYSRGLSPDFVSFISIFRRVVIFKSRGCIFLSWKRHMWQSERLFFLREVVFLFCCVLCHITLNVLFSSNRGAFCRLKGACMLTFFLFLAACLHSAALTYWLELCVFVCVFCFQAITVEARVCVKLL